MDISQDLIRGTVVPVVLAMLKDRAMYGYEIVKLVNARTNRALEMKEGTLYPALHKLEADGLVSASWREGEGDAPRRRKYYALTRTGRLELEKRVREWDHFSNAIHGILKGE